MEKISTQVLVVGAGVVGLSIARKLSKKYSLVLIEKNSNFGCEISSRNSEVIHSGVHYPKDSEKTKLCISGKGLLYEYCQKKGVWVSRLGKYIIATEVNELEYLEKLVGHCKELKITVQRVSKAECKKNEPEVNCLEALYFPESGIIDSHEFMQKLVGEIANQKGIIAYEHKVLNIVKVNEKWETEVDTPNGVLKIESDTVVNAAGLGATELSNKALHTKQFEHRYCRGRYFSLPTQYAMKFKHLIYPVPSKDGLGVHLTLDRTGAAKLGPDVDWCLDTPYEKVQTLYDCNWEEFKPSFLKAVNRYCPAIKSADLTPMQIGVRPKLFIDGLAYPDFLIENKGGFIHCLGIESPGLTASISIANKVESLL